MPLHAPQCDRGRNVHAAPVTFSATDTTTAATFAWSWSPLGATLPPGLTLSLTGVLSGTPTQALNTPYMFNVTVTDSTGSTTSAQFSLTVQPAPLTFATPLPLFNGTVGQPYSQPLQVTGGVPPYTWSITAGSIAPLTLNPNPGNPVNVSGTPTAQGTLTVTVQVTDSSTPKPQTLSQPITISVDYPSLVIQTSATLPPANVGLAYSQTITATGGDGPTFGGQYTWSVASSSALPAGLSLSASGVLSGTPTTTSGQTPFSFGIQVADAATNPQHTATRTFSLVVSAVTLTIPTVTLAGGTAGVSYSQPLSATGGTPPYSWTATGLPTGLSVNPTSGTISGTPLAAGQFQIVAQVTDSSPSPNVARQGFSLNVALPPVPSVSLTGIPSSSNAASQVPVQVSISQPYSGDITGQLTLSFTPTQQGANDATIQFSTSGATATFDIPAGQTSSSASLQFQTGTLPGTITVTLSQVMAFQVNVTPSTPPSQTVTIPNSAPVITSATLSVSGQNISVVVVGYTPTLAASQAVFNFGVSGNDQLKTSQFTANAASAFSSWFGTACSATVTVCPNNYGSQFTYTQVLAVQGDPTAVTLSSVSLTNGQGTTSYTPTQ
ncbi:MAG TPA: putative Ig domain-containing protein [Bryobacteraceae bacterium]